MRMLSLATAFVALCFFTGCSEDKAVEPKAQGTPDTRLKMAGSGNTDKATGAGAIKQIDAR